MRARSTAKSDAVFWLWMLAFFLVILCVAFRAGAAHSSPPNADNVAG